MHPIPRLAFPLLLLAPMMAAAENWPHWRGDLGNSVSLTATPPTAWSDSQNVKWKVEVPGRGSGSPIVWEDRVFVVSAVDQGGGTEEPEADRSRRRRPSPPKSLEFVVLCYDRGTGELRWRQTAVTASPHQSTHPTNGYASASPCTDGEHLYAYFGSRGLFCYTLDGKLEWKRDDFGEMDTRNEFGEGSSPTLAGERIIVPWDHEGPSFLYALDKRTGETVWKVEREEPTNWATPLIVTHDGQQQIIMNGQNAARAYDLESGRELWRCGGQTDRPIASPVHADGVVYVGSGYRGAFLGAFRLGGQDDIADTEYLAWAVYNDTPDIASPVLTNGRLYYTKAKTGILTCVDAKTGETHFGPVRVPGLDGVLYSSPVAAAGHIYFTNRNGTTVVIKDRDRLEVVAENHVGETVDATPALADGELFLRGEKHLFCISES